ncbi:MAG TPA: response regulator [Candidatus Binatia bacterium]|nr:response regulator [Candidatus Binatia bacterium]
MDAHPVILIAEDNENDIFMLRRAFTQLEIDSPILIVSDGEQAISYLHGDGKYSSRAEYPLPDLLLLDLKMPRTNGFEVLQWIRGNPSLASLRVVVLTTSEQIRDINRAYQLGANSFLVKPVHFDDFRNTLKAIYDYWLLNKVPQISRPAPLRADRQS